MNLPLRVLLVDDEPLARAKLRRLLADETGVEVAGEAGSVAEARERLLEVHPDLVFLDIQMPGGDGFALIESLPAAERPARIGDEEFVTRPERGKQFAAAEAASAAIGADARAHADLAQLLKRVAPREETIETQISRYCGALAAYGRAVKAEPIHSLYLINWANLRQILGSGAGAHGHACLACAAAARQRAIGLANRRGDHQSSQPISR